MPNKMKTRLPQDPIAKALVFLEANDFSGFLDQIALLGEWLQNNHHLSHYKGNETTLRERLQPHLQKKTLTAPQVFAFETLQNAWSDSSVPRLRHLELIDNPNIPNQPNSCFVLKKTAAPWQIIPVDAAGNTQDPLNYQNLDDVEEILKTLASSNDLQQEPILMARLRRALKRANLAGIDQSHARVKANLPKSNRHRLKLGLEAFKILCIDDAEFEQTLQNPDCTFKNLLLAHSLDVAVQKAIREYKTPWQKIKRGFEYTLAAITAFAYGTVEMVAAMVGFFVAAGIVWTNPWLALLGVFLLAGAVLFPIPSTWTNWKLFSTYLPDFFDKIGGEYREINSPFKKVLFWILSPLAFTTGVAAGAMAYTATIALSSMLGLGAISVIFPPFGLLFAAAITFSQTFTILRNFTTILRKENSWKSFKKPFSEVKTFLHDNQASKGRRLFIWSMVVGLALVALVGLMMSCFTSTRSVGKLLIDQLQTAPQKALACGIAISAVCSFFSRLYLTVSSTLASALNLSKRLFTSNTSSSTPSIPVKTKIAVLIDSTLAGAFYAWSILTLCQKTPTELQNDIDLHISGLGVGSASILAAIAGLTSLIRNGAISLDHAGRSDPLEQARQQFTISRVSRNLRFFNPCQKQADSPPSSLQPSCNLSK